MAESGHEPLGKRVNQPAAAIAGQHEFLALSRERRARHLPQFQSARSYAIRCESRARALLEVRVAATIGRRERGHVSTMRSVLDRDCVLALPFLDAAQDS